MRHAISRITLPLLASLAIASLAAVFIAAVPAAIAGELVFEPVEVPRTDDEKKITNATRSATIDGRKLDVTFRPLLQGAQQYGRGTFGLALNARGEPVKDGKGQPVVSTYADFTSLLPRGDQVLSVTHFESLPSALYLSRLRQDRATGGLTAVETRSLKLSHLGGIFNPCAGVVTPWGTHMGGEEYPPDMRVFEQALATSDKSKLTRWIPQKLRYFGINPQEPDFAEIKARFKPYRYGYPFEVKVRDFANVDVVRHYAMGRFSHELAYVMPDRRTVYMSDDGDNTGFFMFVADRPGDMSAGKLYAARWEQTSRSGGSEATANLSWIDLGHATSAQVSRAVEAGVSFSGVFETADMTADGKCPTGFESVNFVGELDRRSGECLKLKPGQETIASRIETRRFAAMKGATTEFNKAEGLTFDPKRKRLYKSLTSIDRGMADGMDKGKPSDRFDRGGPNHIRLGFNPCGVVFSIDLARDDKIGSDYVARSMAPLLSGKFDPSAGANYCALEGIANPDNLTFIPEHDTLIVAEDSGGGHENDAIWAYDIERNRLTRIMTVPVGGEATGVHWHRNVNGYSYLTAVVQHPFGDGVQKRNVKPPSDDPIHLQAVVGVIGPFPEAAVSPRIKGKK